MQSFLGSENRRILEGLMTEIILAQNISGTSPAVRNQMKAMLLPKLQKLRQKAEDSDDE
jgi:hypothetical protein